MRLADDSRPGGGIPGLTWQRVVVVTAVFIVIYSGFTIAGNAARSYELSRQTRGLEQQISQEKSEYQQLNALRQYMQTDGFIEAQARREGLEKPGDHTIVVSAPTALPAAVGTPSPWWDHYYAP